MSLKRACISPSALGKIRALVKSSGAHEIGGPMVGYVTDENELIITDVAGPGLNGKCMPFNVTVDGEHSQQFCDLAFRDSGGKHDFVGDWHCHPSICIRPSKGDRQAMKLLAETPGLIPNPVSLIYSSLLRIFRIYEWVDSEQSLVAIPHRRLKSDPQLSRP
jgi:integrative and conjugative element protein (TIGR02256 family)